MLSCDPPLKKPLRILHVFGRMAFGGAEKRTLDLMRNLDRERYRLHFCTLSGLPGELDEEARSLGGEIHPCPLGISFPRRIRRLIKEGRFDAVHSHVHYFSGVLLRAAAREAVPVRIAHFRSTHDSHADSLRRRLQRRVTCRMIDMYATHVLAVSEGVMDACWGVGWREDPRCSVIYNGLDTAPFAGPPDREGVFREFSIPAEGILHIHVGNFHAAKNHERLIGIFSEIVKRDPRSRLLLVGRGSAEFKKHFKEVVARLGLDNLVHHAGQRSDVPRLLKAADLMILPSKWEGFPGVVLEACAAGLPVVASDLAGVMEISAWFPGVIPFSLKAGDAEWASAALGQLSGNEGRIGRPATVEHFQRSAFGIHECVRKHCSIWEGNRLSSIGSKGGPSGGYP